MLKDYLATYEKTEFSDLTEQIRAEYDRYCALDESDRKKDAAPADNFFQIRELILKSLYYSVKRYQLRECHDKMETFADHANFTYKYVDFKGSSIYQCGKVPVEYDVSVNRFFAKIVPSYKGSSPSPFIKYRHEFNDALREFQKQYLQEEYERIGTIAAYMLGMEFPEYKNAKIKVEYEHHKDVFRCRYTIFIFNSRRPDDTE